MEKRFVKKLTIEYEDGSVEVKEGIGNNIRHTTNNYYLKGALQPSEARTRHEIIWDVGPEERNG